MSRTHHSGEQLQLFATKRAGIRDQTTLQGARGELLESSELPIESELSESIPIGSAKVARVLDPIAHELRTGEAPANVLAEYLQSAKDYLFGGDSSNERVERDMEVVLKFLKARDAKGIRPEERDNILKRITRWKEALVETH